MRSLNNLLHAGLDRSEARVSIDVLYEEAQKSGTTIDQQLLTVEKWIQRRARREPLQYIVGAWPWAGVDLKVRPPVLVPRPETEELVELVVLEVKACSKSSARGQVSLVDVCTGSGAIAIAAMKRLMGLVTHAVAIDASLEAVELARENATLHAPTLIVEQTRFQAFSPQSRFDVLVANPPYLPYLPAQPEVSSWEDPMALLGGEPNGAGLVLELLVASERLVKPGGSLLLETHESHPRGLQALLNDSPVLPDLTLHPASGLGANITAGGPVPDWVQDVRSSTRTSIQSGLQFHRAYADAFGRPRFVHLRRT